MSNSLFQKPGVTKGAWKSNHGPMNIIDFSKIEKLEDTYAAYGCITVCTSNGKIGTITHLDTTDIDRIEEFVKILDDELKENKENSKVFLSGGSSLNESKNLSEKIQQIIQNHGYIIIESYLDHKIKNPTPKIAILEKDKILIKEFIHGKNKDQITEINFNDGNKNTYLKDRELPDFVRNKNK